MTRPKSVAIAMAVVTAVVVATAALALNAGFVGESEAAISTEEVPVTTTTTYEQYLEEWYAANPTTTAPTTTLPPATTTLTPEPVVVYEYVDVPVAVPPPEIVYVTVPPETAAPAPTTPAVTTPPASATTPATDPPTIAPTTTRAPTTTQAPMELLEFDLYGFADVTIASHGPGNRLQVWEVDQNSPWVWEIEDDNGSEVQIKFFNTNNGKEAKLELEIRGNSYRLKTEGDGYPEREQTL